MEQARSRVSFYGLAGVPVTFGDHLPDLEQERVELLRRAIPVADIHPMDMREIKRDTPYIMVNLNVAKSFGSWNVIDILNYNDSEKDIRLDIVKDLCLDAGNGEAYIAYDFWNGKFLGIFKETLNFTLPAYGSKVVRISRLADHPQLISTSRHITQGAFEIEALDWDSEKRILSGKSKVVGGEAYKIVLYAQEGCNPVKAACGSGAEGVISDNGNGVWTAVFTPEKSRTEEWTIEF